MKRSRPLILVALLLTLVSTFFLYRYIESLRQVPEVQVKYGNVVVATANIPQHVKITEEMVTLKSVPEEAIHPDAAKAITELVGLTTNMEIVAEEQILKSKISSTDQKNSLSYQIPENMRAIVVPTTEVSGLAGYLEKGDKVDILVTYDKADIFVPYTNQTGSSRPVSTPPSTTTPADTQPGATTPASTTPTATAAPVGSDMEYIETITQLQNIEVLELGIKQALTPDGEPVVADGVPTSVTLLVTPQQAEVIAFMINSGSFQMSLRNPVDGLKVPLDKYGSGNFEDWRNR